MPINWDKIAKGAGELLTKVEENLHQKEEELKKKFPKLLREKTDREILGAYRNMSVSDWRYEHIENEARRRDLI